MEDDVRLARLDATLWDDSRYAYVRHVYYGWRKDGGQEFVWRRTYKPIGLGGFGAVYREECVEGAGKGAARAVKILPKPATLDTRRIDISRELEAIARFSRPEFARYFVNSQGWYEDPTSISIVMELLPLGSLQQYIGKAMPETECKLLVSQMLEGLGYMHMEGYAHRDLKPQNLLVAQRGPAWHIKIADFGLSKRVAEGLSSLHSRAGTPGYMAPEVLGLEADSDDSDDSGDEHQRSYTPAVDIWAVGAIAFQLLSGLLPFPSSDQRPLRKFVKGKTSFPSETLRAKGISDAASALIRSLMAPRPSSRPSTKTSLQHGWFATLQPGSPSGTTSRRMNDPPSVFESVPSAMWTNSDSGYDETVPAREEERDLYPTQPAAPTLPRISISISKPEVREFDNVTEDLQDADFSPNGMLIALSFKDGSFGCWDTERGTRVNSLGGSTKRFDIVASSPDNKLIASASQGRAVRLWDVARGREIKRLQSPPLALYSVIIFSPDAKLIASSTFDGVIHLWDAVSGAQIHKLEGHAYTANKIAFSPDGKLIAAGSIDGGVNFWNTASGKRVKQLEGRSQVLLVAFSPDGQLIASSDGSGTMSLWQVSSGVEVRTLPITEVPLQGMAFSPDGRVIACCHRKGASESAMRLWDVANGEELGHLAPSVAGDVVHDVAFLSDGRLTAVVEGSDSRCLVYFWTISKDGQLIAFGEEGEAGIPSTGLAAIEGKAGAYDKEERVDKGRFRALRSGFTDIKWAEYAERSLKYI